MRKTLTVATREFLATVVTKGFILGVLVTPLLIGIVVVGAAVLFSEKPPNVEGELALVDPTGEVTDGLREYLQSEALAARWNEVKTQALDEAPPQVRRLAEGSAGRAADAALGEVPTIEVSPLPDAVDLDAEKNRLRQGSAGEPKRLALAVVHADAVHPAAGGERYGSFDLYVRDKLDDRVTDEIRSGLRHAIVGARLRSRGYDRGQIEALTTVAGGRSMTVTKTGEQENVAELKLLVPAGFMILLLVSVFTSGQYIMTTTIEEKSSRVVEVLLSAVSPMELMTGKILGQMGVGLVILALYAGMGITGLASFALLGLIDRWLFFYLIVFYFIAYFVQSSLMAAIGSAVNELREAQTLMTPVMVVMMIPWLLWLPISRDPNSAFATITTFIPPINTFVALLRLSSTSPPPLWQIWVSIAIGAASVYAALWFAAKVFRIGILMYGKPPNFATLVRWARMA